MQSPEQTLKAAASVGPWIVRSLVLGLVLGAVYLYAVRGSALLMDLASGAAGLFCL
jgi:hypothetical protein